MTAYDLRISDWSSDVCSSDLQLAVVVGDPADAPAPVLRRIARFLGQASEAPRDLPVAVVEIVLRQVAEVVDLQLVAEVHRDPLLAPAAVHLVVGPDRGAQVVRVLPRLPDLAAEHAGADVPALGRPPVVVDADHGGLATQE